ncbi:Ig-like domain-containing protein [Corallococcus aberystwythensis]|uniref:Tandem-95 repeat protein n=1 Tax=Corallococcus aberystwythensis TaxID=2316722 RepID=A0A3A8QX91_9BACT|nr:Ig-like domain-containing protein [Corallococcus aberystwythensis]RKH73399.1 hypothetical protein D7W81_04075 [Corallococcus aberystwythensis]
MASAAALRAGLVLGLAVSTLAACGGNDPPPNDPPVARDVTLEAVEDTPLEVQLPATGNGAITFTIVDAPDHGKVGEVSANGSITYTPGADDNGEDALIFRATNSQGQSAQGTVTLTITPVNDTPTLSPVENQSITDGSSTGDLAFTVGDVETAADSLTFTATSSNTDLVPNAPANLIFGGSGSTALVTNQSTVHGIAIDVAAGRLYWADWLGTALRSTNLADGGDIQTVNSGSARNLGLAWMPAP